MVFFHNRKEKSKANQSDAQQNLTSLTILPVESKKNNQITNPEKNTWWQNLLGILLAAKRMRLCEKVRNIKKYYFTKKKNPEK